MSQEIFWHTQKLEPTEFSGFKCRDFTPGLQDPIWPKQVTDSDRRMYDVIVIGAGVAGLEAAHELDSKGMDVVLLEARDRVGGRLNTYHFSDVGLDLGGTWIHGYNASGTDDQNPIYKIAIANHIRVIPTTDDTTELRYSSGLSETSDEIDGIVKDFGEYVGELISSGKYGIDGLKNYSVKDVMANYTIAKNVTKEKRALYDFVMTYDSEFDQAGDANEISGNAPTATQYFNNLTSIEVIFPEGYNQITNCLAGGLDIRHATVKSVNYTNPSIVVSTDRGNFEAKYVVSTLPLGVLKNNPDIFYPTFNQPKIDAIHKLKMGTFDKTYLIFNDVIPFLNDTDWIIRMVNKTDNNAYGSAGQFFFSMYNDIHKPVILAFSFGSSAKKLETKSDAMIQNETMAALREIYPNETIPEPRIIQTRWAMDPLSGGSYSFIPTNSSKYEMDELAKPIDGKLFFAGEATNWHYYGTVHGAYISGYRAAQEILKADNKAVDTIREQLDHGIHPDDVCDEGLELKDKTSENPRCVQI